MPAYMITYDNRPPRDYEALYSLLEIWDAVLLAQSVWLVDLNATSVQVRDAVRSVLEPDDIVAVLELPRDADWAVYASQRSIAWLQSHVAA